LIPKLFTPIDELFHAPLDLFHALATPNRVNLDGDLFKAHPMNGISDAGPEERFPEPKHGHFHHSREGRVAPEQNVMCFLKIVSTKHVFVA
jgi:hypothetical protein